MIDQAVGLLYLITVALKGPVVVGILLALVWALFEMGVFLRELVERTRASKSWAKRCAAFDEDGAPALGELLADVKTPDLVKKAGENPPARLLEEMEFLVAKRLSRMRLGLRLGPVVGLMGTLIPMGPALRSITEGNLAGMSNDLIIAFGTTVVGLFVGALCYVMLVVRQYWYARDMADTERLVRIADEKEKS